MKYRPKKRQVQAPLKKYFKKPALSDERSSEVPIWAFSSSMDILKVWEEVSKPPDAQYAQGRQGEGEGPPVSIPHFGAHSRIFAALIEYVQILQPMALETDSYGGIENPYRGIEIFTDRKRYL